MEPFVLFNLQFTLSLVAFALVASWYIAPGLATLPRERALVPLLLVHVFRYTPLTLLVPGQVEPSVPQEAATAIAYGDFVSAILAFAAVIMLRHGLPGAVAVTWVFSVVGIADVLMAIRIGIAERLYQYELGFNWYILNFYVPVICVTHVMILSRLLKKVARTAG